MHRPWQHTRHHPTALRAMDNSSGQERISSLAQDVWSGKFLASSKKLPVTVDSKEDTLVDGMGFEPTTPTLRTWCSPN